MDYVIVFFVALVIGFIIGRVSHKRKAVKGGRHGGDNGDNKQQ